MTNSALMDNPCLDPHSHVPAKVLLIATWFGLATGLLEGTCLLAFQELGWLNWHMALKGVSLEIIWIAALFDLLLFGALGGLLALAALLCPRPSVIPAAVGLFTFLAAFDWLALTSYLQHYAALLLAAGLAIAFSRWYSRHASAALRFWYRTLLWVAGLTLLAWTGIQGGLWLQERLAIAWLPSAPRTPNILVIVVDTLRADHLSAYGYARATSPYLEHMARQGVLFGQAFATSSWTPPSHASLLTGRYPYEHGVEWSQPLDGRYPTLTEALRARGYRTGAFSANSTWFCRRWGFGRGFIRFEDYFHSLSDMAVRTLYGRAIDSLLRRLNFGDLGVRKWAADVNHAALRWIDRDPGVPFFAFLNYVDTHAPYMPPPPHRTRFSQLPNPGGLLIDHEVGDHRDITPEQLQGEIDAYDGAITYVDEHIGQLLSVLHQRGLADSTLIAVTSDHGESFGEHGLFFHRNALYREVIHVPLIMWWPGHIPTGVRVAQPVTNAALPATIMDIIGAGEPPLFPGPPLTHLWTSPQASTDWPYPLIELAQQPFEALKQLPVYHGSMRSLVSPQWHYIVHPKLGTEVYDWKSDPQESHNLAQRLDMQEVIAQFRSQLRQFSLALGER